MTTYLWVAKSPSLVLEDGSLVQDWDNAPPVHSIGLEWLRSMPDEVVIWCASVFFVGLGWGHMLTLFHRYLTSFRNVGPKTAGCIKLLQLGRQVLLL